MTKKSDTREQRLGHLDQSLVTLTMEYNGIKSHLQIMKE